MKTLLNFKRLEMHGLFLTLACISALLSVYLVEHYIAYISNDRLLSYAGSIFLGIINYTMTYRVFNSTGWQRIIALLILTISVVVSITLIYSWLNADEIQAQKTNQAQQQLKADTQQSTAFNNYQKSIALNNTQIDNLLALNKASQQDIKDYDNKIDQGIRPKNNRANKGAALKAIAARNKSIKELQASNEALLIKQLPAKTVETPKETPLFTLPNINWVNLALASLFELFVILFHLVAAWFKADKQQQQQKQYHHLQDLINQVDLKEKQLTLYFEKGDKQNKEAKVLLGQLHVQTELSKQVEANLTSRDKLHTSIIQEIEDAESVASRLESAVEQAHRANEKLIKKQERYNAVMLPSKRHDGTISSPIVPPSSPSCLAVPPSSPIVPPSSLTQESSEIDLKGYLHFFKKGKIKTTNAGNITDKAVAKKTKLTYENARLLIKLAYVENILTRKPSGKGYCYQYNNVWPATQKPMPLSVVQ